MTVLYIVLFTIGAMIINRSRGGLCLFGKDFDKYAASKWYLDWFFGDGGLKHSLYFAVITFLVTSNIGLSLAVLIGLYIGEKFSWGLWIGEITNMKKEENKSQNDDGKNEGIRFLAGLFYDEEKDWYKNSYISLIFRGMYWFFVPILAFWYFGLIPLWFAIFTLAYISVLMPESYQFGRKLYEKYGHFTIFKKLEVDGGWSMGEVVYGLFQGVVFGCLLFL